MDGKNDRSYSVNICQLKRVITLHLALQSWHFFLRCVFYQVDAYYLNQVRYYIIISVSKFKEDEGGKNFFLKWWKTYARLKQDLSALRQQQQITMTMVMIIKKIPPIIEPIIIPCFWSIPSVPKAFPIFVVIEILTSFFFILDLI